ncbi:MAG TPA: hypothetical protein ENJ43_06470 [Gammaproteobacteria bacterium]|nr:hypothetical protein [Gammaproteobacteria bacterium]
MSCSREKKVIFIGGTSYSGSTLLDMLLANSPSGFSCGEVYAMFHPFRKHHVDPACGCGDPQCNIWKHLKRQGPKKLYHSIFEMFPEVDCIVDSSKDPMWIRDRSNDLAGSGIAVRNVLIWKTPQEFHQSRKKRHQEHRWESEWINYHRHYFSLVDEWISLPYAELAKSPRTLKILCERLQIPWFEGKEAYWEKRHHTLFGNTSAKIHLYDKESKQFQQCRQELSGQDRNEEKGELDSATPYKEIYYQAPQDDMLQDPSGHYRIMADIENILVNSSLYSEQSVIRIAREKAGHLRASRVYRTYRRLRQAAMSLKGAIAGF